MAPVTSAALPRFDHFETQRAGPVALLRINRPGKANALTAAFWPQLRGLLDAAAEQPGIRAVVLTGSGDRSFSAGGQVAGGRVIRDRLGLLRRTAGDYRGSSPGESTGT